MNPNTYIKDKNYYLSNHKLIGYMVDIGSKFIDLLQKAFKDKKIYKKFKIKSIWRNIINVKYL